MTRASDELPRPHAGANDELALSLLRASTDALLDPQVLLEATRDSSGRIVDFLYREVNQATCDYLGLSRAELIGRGVVETMPGIRDTLLPGYIRCLDTGEPLILNDFSYDNEVLTDTRRYDLRATRATPTSLVLTWRDVTERFQNIQRIADSEARYRRTMEHAAVGMCLVSPEGRVSEVNEAMAQFFGYDSSTLNGTDWQEFTGPEYLDAEQHKVTAILEGRIDSYRMVKQYVHAEGHLIWGDLSVRGVRDEQGHLMNFVALITDITARVEADERNRVLAQQLQQEKVQLAASEETIICSPRMPAMWYSVCGTAGSSGPHRRLTLCWVDRPTPGWAGTSWTSFRQRMRRSTPRCWRNWPNPPS